MASGAGDMMSERFEMLPRRVAGERRRAPLGCRAAAALPLLAAAALCACHGAARPLAWAAGRTEGSASILVRPSGTGLVPRSRGLRLVARAAPFDTFVQGMRTINGGRATMEDMQRGVRMVNEAAELGCREAQNTLGCLFSDGAFGVPRDKTQALQWFQLAAGAGDADANFNIAILYLQGDGVQLSKFEAAKYFRMAGEAGHVGAMTNLAGMLIKGDGVPKDMQLGAQWLVKAAQKGEHMEELMDKIASGNLDQESAMRLNEMIEKLRTVNQDNPFLKPKGDVKVRNYDN